MAYVRASNRMTSSMSSQTLLLVCVTSSFQYGRNSFALCCVEGNAMNCFLHNFLAVVTSLVLAFPPGSCSAFTQHEQTESAPMQATCCHETVPNHPFDSGNSPAQPSVNCCCARDAALPKKSVQPTDSFNLAFFAVADHFPLNVDPLMGGEGASAPLRSGPTLQVLLCVWRC